VSAQNPVDTGDTPARIPMCSLQHAMLLHSARARGAGLHAASTAACEQDCLVRNAVAPAAIRLCETRAAGAPPGIPLP